MKPIRTFSKADNCILLAEQYLFAHSFFNGFTERLLGATFLVDYEYNYTLELTAFQHQNKTINNSNNTIEKGVLTGKEL